MQEKLCSAESGEHNVPCCCSAYLACLCGGCFQMPAFYSSLGDLRFRDCWDGGKHFCRVGGGGGLNPSTPIYLGLSPQGEGPVFPMVSL